MDNKLPVAALAMFLFSSAVAAQTTDASLSGTVTDPSGATVPKARVFARNTNTGIVSQMESNAAGVYSFAALQPGPYQITAEREGFQKHIVDSLELGIGAKVTLNLALKLGSASETVEVQAEAAQLESYSTSSVGEVVNGRKVLELPLAGRNAIDLLRTQAGVTGPNSGQNFNGTRVGALNITVDGTNAIDNLINSLFLATVTSSISVDRIEEFRVTTSPADAELGRGSGQIQVLTRSGTNTFHGSLFEEHRDRSLTANTYFNNLRGRPRDLLIRNFFGGRVGGPIKKNRTFFNFYYEKRFERFSQTVTNTVYTATARQGLFRYFPGARNANANAAIPTVDFSGNPVKPSTATGELQSVTVFGRDPNRLTADAGGIIAHQLDLMPMPNDFRAGDGLNTAGFTWNRPRPYDFDQFDIHFDHQINARHRLSFVYSEQGSQSSNFNDAQPFPTVPGGGSPNETTTETFSMTSVFRPNLLSEFHTGAFRPRQTLTTPWTVGGNGILPNIKGQPFAINFNGGPTSPLGPGVGGDPSTRISPVYQFGDTMTWVKGRHNFRFGGEVRFVSAAGFDTFYVMPRINLGSGAVPVQNLTTTTLPGIGQNLGGAQGMLLDLAGSVNFAIQNFNSPGGPNPHFLSGQTRYQHVRAPEYSGFFKDDFHLSPSLTLNLGVRYELYSVPVEDTGVGLALQGGSGAIFGVSGTSFADLFQPNHQAGSQTLVRPIGPGTANPGDRYFEGDHNNFGPAVGLAWVLPGHRWFSNGKTIFRGGYGVGFERNPIFLNSSISGQEPGYSTLQVFVPFTQTNLSNIVLPLQPAAQPLAPIPFTDRNSSVYTLDSHLRTPYYQNFNVSLEHAVNKDLFTAVRWVGTKGTKLIQQANINEVNIFENGILDAFRITQAGGNAPLFDKIFLGLGGVNGTTVHGSDLVRSNNGGMQGFLANNDVAGFANFLNSTPQLTGQNGGLLRRVGLPENFIVGNPQFSSSTATLTSNLGSSTYHALQVEVIKRFNSGWLFQANYTFSKALGNYDGDGSALERNFRTLRDRGLDKTILGFNRAHAWKANGIWELPFGPGKSLGRNTRGWFSQVIGGWQTGWILTIQSGPPISITGVGAFNNGGSNNMAVAAAALASDLGHTTRVGDGVVYFSGLRQVVDPYVAQITAINGIQQRSAMLAITDASGKLLLVNAQPGQMGTLASNFFTGPRLFDLDLNLLKRFRFKERYEFYVRADAVNATNRAQFNNPDTNINSPTFGRITDVASGSNRVVVLSARFSF